MYDTYCFLFFRAIREEKALRNLNKEQKKEFFDKKRKSLFPDLLNPTLYDYSTNNNTNSNDVSLYISIEDTDFSNFENSDIQIINTEGIFYFNSFSFSPIFSELLACVFLA